MKTSGAAADRFSLLHIARLEFRCYINAVVISFDPAKRASNIAKHGLDLADAGKVLDGPCLERLDDRYDYGEDRWVSVGMLQGDVVVCVWADWGEEARIISLRKATANEEESYFTQIRG